MLLVADGAGRTSGIPLPPEAAALYGHRPAERAALHGPGDHARRLLGAHPDRAAATSTRFYYDVIEAFHRRTGCPVIVNTSFNVRGEPIVCTPEDAYRCFMRTEMDVLVLEHFILEKAAQPRDAVEDDSWRAALALD